MIPEEDDLGIEDQGSDIDGVNDDECPPEKSNVNSDEEEDRVIKNYFYS